MFSSTEGGILSLNPVFLGREMSGTFSFTFTVLIFHRQETMSSKPSSGHRTPFSCYVCFRGYSTAAKLPFLIAHEVWILTAVALFYGKPPWQCPVFVSCLLGFPTLLCVCVLNHQLCDAGYF